MKAVQISDEVYAELDKIGKAGETIDEILRSILNIQTPYRPMPTRRMTARIRNDKLDVFFQVLQKGPAYIWDLPDKNNKETIGRIRKEAVNFVHKNRGTYGQKEAVLKEFTKAGYYLTYNRRS